MRDEYEETVLDILQDYRQERIDRKAAAKAAASKPENLTIDQRYQSQIAAAQKRLDAVQSKMDDDEEAGRPINGELWDQRSERTERVKELQQRFKVEVEERERFVKDWLGKARYGLKSDALKVWESVRLQIATESGDALIREAQKQIRYQSL